MNMNMNMNMNTDLRKKLKQFEISFTVAENFVMVTQEILSFLILLPGRKMFFQALPATQLHGFSDISRLFLDEDERQSPLQNLPGSERHNIRLIERCHVNRRKGWESFQNYL